MAETPLPKRQGRTPLCKAFLTAYTDAAIIHEFSNRGPGKDPRCQDQTCRMLGYSREELIGKPVSDLDEPSQKERSPKIGRQLRTTKMAVFDTEHVREDHTRFPVEVRARCISYQGVPAVLALVRDRTHREQEKRALILANRKLHPLSDITRHDIMNRMSVLLGFLEIAGTDTDDPRLLEKITRSQTVAGQISRYIQFTREYQDLGVRSPDWILVTSLVDTTHQDFPGLVLETGPRS